MTKLSEYPVIDSLYSYERVPAFSQTPANECVVVFPASSFSHQPPQFTVFDEPLPNASRNIITAPSTEVDPIYTVRFLDATLFGSSGIITSNDQYPHDLAIHAGRHSAPSDIETREDGRRFVSLTIGEQTDHVDESAALLFFDPASGENYSHWLLQTLPKLKILERAGASFSKIIVQPNIKPYQRETLERLGVTPDMILERKPDAVTKFRELFVVYTWGGMIQDLSIYDDLSRTFPKGVLGPEKIYVSRLDARITRRFLNEKEVVETVKELGYTVLTPGELSLEDEVTLFRDARIVIGPLGAGLYNTLFTKEGATVVALSDPCYAMDWPLQIASLKQHKLGFYFGNSFTAWDSVHRGTHNSWIVDTERLRSILVQLG